MKKPILYSIWLNNNCTLYSGAYCLLSTDKLYYIDSKTDMEELYRIFKDSIKSTISK